MRALTANVQWSRAFLVGLAFLALGGNWDLGVRNCSSAIWAGMGVIR